MPRYSIYIHLRRARYVGVVTQDIEFERIDINPCRLSDGNPKPNFFAGTDRCKQRTTMCEPLNGFGFRRGGYQCVCRPGYYYPWWHDGPFLGLEIEEATNDEYAIGFDCIPVEELQVYSIENPVFVERKKRSLGGSSKKSFMSIFERSSPRVKLRSKRAAIEKIRESAKKVEKPLQRKKRFVPRFEGETKKIRHKREAFDEGRYAVMQQLLTKRYQTNGQNCQSKSAAELFLPGDVAYDVERQFEAQGRTALRLAHFLSNFMQNVDEYEDFGSIKGDRRLNETQIFGEVIANVMGDFRILGSGVFFDRYKFRMSPPVNNTDPRYVNGITREFFGPYSWRRNVNQEGLDEIKAIDFAGEAHSYVDKSWFRDIKGRWATNFEGLKTNIEKPMIRSDYKGTSLVRFEHYPLTFRAPLYEHGKWLRPQFKCDGRVDDWVITYVVPFFGPDMLKQRIEFKGVVTVDVQMDYLTINQCPQEFYEANAFKNTARCHFQSTYCVPLEGMRFQRGGYKCECRQGYEYPFNDLAWYFDGQTMEEEYGKYIRGDGNRYETLKCRIAGASAAIASYFTTMACLLFIILNWQ
ncbi:hypothetical protein ScPMuIL_012861 [Solemya velum]